jgi:hypothetical protein
VIALAPLPKHVRSPRYDELLQDNFRRLRERAAKALKPHRAQRPSKWIPRVVRLEKEREASSRVNFVTRPWWKDIVDALYDPEVEEVSVCAATQLGKTLILICAILWCAENAPGPGMVVVPDRDAAIELRDRIYAHAEATVKRGLVERISVPPKRLWNTRYIDLGQMRVYLAWSGSQQRLRGRPCRYVWLTEIDVYARGSKKAGNPLAAAHQRTKAFFRGLHWHESSPAPDPSDIANLEANSAARYRWVCPCPKCGLWQELRFFPHTSGEHAGHGGIAGIKDEHGEYLSVEEARDGAYYVCLQGCKIGNEQKQTMLERGKQLPYDCHIDADGKITGPRPSSRRSVGFQLWSVHTETQSWGDLAAAYLEAKEERRLPEFFGNWLGLAYKRDTRVPHWRVLGKKLAWCHERRQVPSAAWFLTAGADVQGENKGVRYVIRAWGPHRTSWLVDWGWIEREPGDENALVKSDLLALGRRVLEARFPVIGPDGKPATNPLGRGELTNRLLCCDSNFLPHKVHRWLRSLPEEWVYSETPRVRAIRGDHQLNPETRWRKNVVESSARNSDEVYEGGLWQWGVYVYPFYDELLQAIQGDRDRDGSWYVTSDCLAQGRAYLEQVVNFGPRVVVDDKTGLKKTIWQPINGRVPIDFWDCEIYAWVAAEMTVGDLGWDPEKWAIWRDQRTAITQAQVTKRRRAVARAESYGER